MMNENLEARGKSLQALMGAMDDDEMGEKIPGMTIKIAPGAQGVQVIHDDEPADLPEIPEDSGDGMDTGGGDPTDPFEQIVQKKKQEQMGGGKRF